MTEILEKSGNFMRGKKWEPCILLCSLGGGLPHSLVPGSFVGIGEGIPRSGLLYTLPQPGLVYPTRSLPDGGLPQSLVPGPFPGEGEAFRLCRTNVLA